MTTQLYLKWMNPEHIFPMAPVFVNIMHPEEEHTGFVKEPHIFPISFSKESFTFLAMLGQWN